MKQIAGVLCLVLFMAAAVGGCGATNRIVSFGKVDETLYRGGQPDTAGLKQLNDLGVKSIINLRMTNEIWLPEPKLAARYAMVYTNFPLDNLSAPSEQSVKQILAAIETLPKPIFIHCQFGCDRTGTIVACYRIKHDRWTNLKALKEAEDFGISPAELDMRRFIAAFGR